MSEDIVNEIKTNVEVLNNKFDVLSENQDKMSKTISNWFKSFVLAFIGVFGGLITFAVGYGGVKNQVDVNKSDIIVLQKVKQDKSTIDEKFVTIIEKINDLRNNETK